MLEGSIAMTDKVPKAPSLPCARITPKMIEAGLAELAIYDDEREPPSECVRRILIAAITSESIPD